MEKPPGSSDTVANDSIKRVSSFFIYVRLESVGWTKAIKNKIPIKSLRRDSTSPSA